MAYSPVRISELKDKGSTFFIEVYVLELRSGISYVAACDEDIVFDDKTFIAIPFSRGDITRNIDSVVNECELKLGDIDDNKLAYIMSGLDFRGCGCTIYRIAYPDSLSNPSEVQCIFKGYIDTPSYSEGVFTCVVKDYFPSLNAPARNFKTPCNSVFGDDVCRMSKDSRSFDIISIKGNTYTISESFPDNYWQYGAASVNGETRNIVSSSGNTVTTHINFWQGEVEKQKVILERGCDKTQTTCRRYGNLKRYSGFPSIPFESRYR